MKKINRTKLFLIIVFAISFTIAGIYYLLEGTGVGTIGFTIFGLIYMYIPAISVVIVKKFFYREKIKFDLLISFKINKWFFIAWLLVPVIIFSTIVINLILPDVAYNSEMSGLDNLLTPEQIEQREQSLNSLPVNLLWLTLLQGLIAGLTVNALAAFGEELAWRGFFLRSYEYMKFFKAAVIIGFIWGIWHAPLVLMGHNYPQHLQIGVFMMIILSILLTPIFLYITIKAKSVIAASIMHGTMNAIAGISIMSITGGNDLTSGITGLAGFITLTIFLIALIIYDYKISKDKIFISKINNYL
ncbi:CPBP family intramembrane glutamic endopeptidase [Nafulsella turpanensis]|uniref:CPBP family intramembrane glutamic endopeptidase n=1 Tax=Nafulsella turpanensis TaxID=1265690 RepID=UPI00034821FE|nr:CPBP family intramembrane glutamic endopeptidase [Nafulsella turpanensis]